MFICVDIVAEEYVLRGIVLIVVPGMNDRK